MNAVRSSISTQRWNMSDSYRHRSAAGPCSMIGVSPDATMLLSSYPFFDSDADASDAETKAHRN